MMSRVILALVVALSSVDSQDKTVESSIAALKALDQMVLTARAPHVGALVRVGEPALPAVLDLLKHDNQIARWAATEVLTNMSVTGRTPKLRFSETAVPTVVNSLAVALKGDSWSFVREGAIGALSNIGGFHQGSREAIVELVAGALSDVSPAVRGSAATSLSGFGPDAKSALSALIASAKDAERRVQDDSAKAPPGTKRKPNVVSPEESARAKILGALGRVGPSNDAAPVLTDALKAEDSLTRWMAAEALARMDPVAPSAVPALREALKDTEKRVREAAAKALKKTA